MLRYLSRWPVAAAGLLLVLSSLAAFRADQSRPWVNPWLDVGVAVAFAAAGTLGRGAVAQRWLMVAVGAAWSVGSWLPGTSVLHQGFLIVALLAFPSGRVRGVPRWVLAFAAVPVGLGLVQQIGVATVFCMVALVTLGNGGGRSSSSVWYPRLAAVAAATSLGTFWWLGDFTLQAIDPKVESLVWQAVLLLIAAAFPVASRRVLRERASLSDVVLRPGVATGFDGLAQVLAEVLDDPSLRVYRWLDSTGRYVDADDAPVAVGYTGRGWLEVTEGARPLAVVEHQLGVLEDSLTADGVAAAVQLTVTNVKLQEQQRNRLKAVEASRARLLAATDRVRERVAAQLRQEVELPLALVGDCVTAVRGSDGVEVLQVVRQELIQVNSAIAALVAGVAPADLGGGRLRDALLGVAEASAVPVSLLMADDAAADRQAETVLYYVCSEALTNAVKHAHARRVDIVICRRGQEIQAWISDDGRGGADASGSGLRGLADRLAASGGRLRVDSPIGTGTVVTASLPVVSQSFSRA